MIQYKESQTKGILWMLFQCFVISLMTVLVRFLSDNLHVVEILLFHNLFAFCFVLLWAIIVRQFKHPTKKFKLHFWRSFLGTISFILYFFSLTMIPLTEVIAISFTGPVIGSVFAAIVFRQTETLNKYKIIALIGGFIGVMVVLRPGIEAVHPGAFLVLLTVCLWSIIGMIIKVMSKTESNLSQILYLTFMMSIFTAPLAYFVWQTPTLTELLWLILLGGLFAINIIAVFNAFKYADITTIAPFDFSRIVYIAILSYLIFGEVIDLWTAIGSVIIVASSVYMHIRQKKATT